MKKSLIISLILLLSVVILMACSNDNVINDGVAKLPKVDAILSGKIVNINENSLLLTNESGLGAYFFVDCKAKLSENGWTYEIGSEAIS